MPKMEIMGIYGTTNILLRMVRDTIHSNKALLPTNKLLIKYHPIAWKERFYDFRTFHSE